MFTLRIRQSPIRSLGGRRLIDGPKDLAMQSLRHSELKTARALEHLTTLKRAGTLIRVQMKDVSDRPFWPAIASNNLRCALDHAIFSLAIKT